MGKTNHWRIPLFDARNQKKAVENWVQKQDKIPSRKEAQKQFPNVPQKIIRTVIQSTKDKNA